jgi:hypothetical protein
MKYFTRSFLNFLDNQKKTGNIKKYCETNEVNENDILQWLDERVKNFENYFNRYFFILSLNHEKGSIQNFFKHYLQIYFTEYSISHFAYSKINGDDVKSEFIQMIPKFLLSIKDSNYLNTLKKTISK